LAAILRSIVGTGLLAVPVLAGSTAYAVNQAFGWKAGLSHGFHEEARLLRHHRRCHRHRHAAERVFEVDPLQAML
jgi:hypothetical protein